MGIIDRGKDYLKKNGIKSTFFTGLQHIENAVSDIGYNIYLKSKKNRREYAAADKQELKISVLVPVYEPDIHFLTEMVQSVLDQTYGNFELILSDGSLTENFEVLKLAKSDKRIRYIRAGEGGGISDNTNEALRVAAGRVVAFMDQDDLIEPQALELIASEFDKGAVIVYTDEDKYLTGKNRYASPYRKRDYNFDLLLSNNYICHMFAVKRSLARQVKGFNPKYDGAQDHDFILRCCDSTDEDKIVHIKKILYHWRAHDGSSAENPMAKVYAYESGKRAVRHFLREKRINAVVCDPAHLGFFRVEYKDEFPQSGYTLFIDDKLTPLTEDHERILSSYFARSDIGIVGGRVISPDGRIMESGYEKDENGRIRSLFQGRDYRLPGAFNLSECVMDTEAVSKYACAVRNELLDCMDGNSYTICSRIRKRGYRVVIDPKVVFVKNR